MILAVIHQKGGTGKSSLSIAMSMWLARRNRTVIILDTDNQATSHTWGERFGDKYGVKVKGVHVRLVSHDVREARQSYDDVIIDLPPTVTEQTEKAIEVADLLLVPMRPNSADLWALDRLIALVLVSDRKPPPPYMVIFNQCTTAPPFEVEKSLKIRKVEALEEYIPFDPAWPDLFEGKDLTPDMESRIGSILQSLPLDNKPWLM